MKIVYNSNLKELARKLRNNSTQSEIKLWKELQNKQIYGYKFIRQKPIGNYIVDFFCNKLKLAIELDGYSHNFSSVFEQDIIKEKYLNGLGITVLRFNDDDVLFDMSNTLREIEGYVFGFENKHTP
jgi:very-short-patch-repair endonuclease